MSALPQSETARPLPLRESAFDRTSGFADYTLSGFANYKLSGFDRTATYLKRMLKRGTGRVIFISSESGINPAPEMAHYSATKTMQLSISRSLAELTKGTKVTVNAILPGSTKTEGVKKFVQEVFPNLPEAEAERRFMAENRATSLIQRLIAPQEIADLVTFVCSDRASAINGAVLRVDGGIVRSVF